MYLFSVDKETAGDFLSIGPSEDTHGKLGPAGSHQPGKPHLARFHLKVYVLNHLPFAVVRMEYIPVLYFKNRLPYLNTFPERIAVGKLPPYHSLDNPVFGKVVLSFLQCFDGMSVTDYGNGIRHITDFVQLM